MHVRQYMREAEMCADVMGSTFECNEQCADAMNSEFECNEQCI